ncbi:unnamed protein product, partial [Polarella glacialis]
MPSNMQPLLQGRTRTEPIINVQQAGGDSPQPKMRRRVSSAAHDNTPLPLPSRWSPLLPSLGLWATLQKLAVLTANLQWWMGFPGKWLWQFVRLVAFVLLMLPGFIPPFITYMWSAQIKKNIPYGPSFRHQLDIYLPAASSSPKNRRAPVVIFISGGAWIIGYKAWGFIMGQLFQQYGVLFIAPDYRNFPEASVGSMVEDVIMALGWIFENLDELGGDLANITLMGQSAGAHLSALALLEQAAREAGRKEGLTWSVQDLVRWVGISGPYDAIDMLPTMRNRGLPTSVIMALMDHDLARFSPTRRVRDLTIADPSGVLGLLPAAHLFHGTADETVHWQQSEAFAQAR